jgi:hypothetical protein
MKNVSSLRLIVFASLTVFALGLSLVPLRALTLASETIWGTAGSDVSEGTAVAADGSAHLVGTTFSADGASNVFLVKTDTTGAVVRQRTWTDPSNRVEARSVAVQQSDGSVYVSGLTFLNGGDAFLLKFAADGLLLSQLTWGTPSALESGAAVAVAPDGSVYVAVTPTFGSIGDVSLVKFNAGGIVEWQKTWSIGGTEPGVAVAPDGSVYVSGVTARADGSFAFDTFLLKVDSSGSLIWQRTYAAGEQLDARGGVAVDQTDGSIYVAGALFASTSKGTIFDVSLLKFTPAGAIVWEKTWGGGDGDEVKGVAVGADGTVALGGSTNSFGVEGDAFVVHLAPDGRGIDARTWGSASLDSGTGVAFGPDGTIWLAGTVNQSPPYVLGRAPSKTARLRGTLATPVGSLADAVGTVGDPAGTASDSDGATGYVEGTDAALVRITP